MLIPIIIYWLPTDSVHSPVSLALVTSWICAMCCSPQICSLPYYQLFCILWRHGCPQVRGGHLRIAPWRLIMSWILCWMQNMQSSLKDGCTYAQLRDNQRNTKNTNKYKVQLHPHAERRICNQVLIVGDNLITDPAVLNRCSNVGNFNIMKNLTQKENCENSDRNGTSDHQSLIPNTWDNSPQKTPPVTRKCFVFVYLQKHNYLKITWWALLSTIIPLHIWSKLYHAPQLEICLCLDGLRFLFQVKT